MRKFTAFAASALMLGLAGAAGAAGTTSLTFRDGQPADRFVLDGASWRCAENVCIATGGMSQPAMRACRRIVAEHGPVSTFTWRGEAFDAQRLAQCNAAAA